MTNQDAIKIIKTARAEVEWEYPMEYAAAFDKAIEVLEQEQRWIPISERLPERVEWYLTSIKWDDGTERVTISWFDGMSFKAEVIAWLPLPEPYKKEREE